VVVFGGAASLIGTIASAFSISQTQSTLEFFMSGSMAKVLTLLAIVGILMLRPQAVRPQSPQITKSRQVMIITHASSIDPSSSASLRLAALLFVILPLSLDVFRLNLVAKYLTYAFVGIGLVLCWGYGGILSLGQGVFFGLGGYCMAMFLKLEASSPENTRIQSTPGIPDFMDWNQITSLPLFWQPFHSLTLTILAIILVPGLFA
jgi:ABC-type branched-subunit amino acid transport system permease subunit